MARGQDERVQEAKRLYLSGMRLIDIANALGIPAGTVRRWKSTYKWDDGNNERSEKKSERSVRKNVVSAVPIDDGTKETLKNEELTSEQQMFCIYYSRTFNASQSYQKAYGCTYNAALSSGPRLLGNARVRKELGRLKEIKRQQIVASEEDMVEMQMRIAFSDIGGYVSFGQETVPLMAMYGPVQITNEETGEKETLTKEVNTIKLNESDSVDTQIIQEVKQGRDGVSIKLADKHKAIEWLSKYFLMHPDDQYKAEYDKKRAEVRDDSAEKILENMKTITEILRNPESNRTISDFE